jgi:hypothetical protein
MLAWAPHLLSQKTPNFDADVEFGLDKKSKAGSGTVGLRFNW